MIGINKLKNNDQSRQLPRTLFLGDLPLLCTDDRLYGLFSPYGRIESIQLKKEEPRDKLFRKNKHVNHSRQDQRHHLSYGFVKFEHHNSAAMALQNLNNIFILGRRIRVCWARDNPGLEYLPIEELESTMQPGGGDKKTAQIHVLYITPIMHATISELDLYEVFRAFGKVVDVSIKKSVINEARQIQSGYGFVHFELSDEGIRSALQAIEEMNHRVINNVTYEVTMTHGLRAHLFYLSAPNQHQPLKSHRLEGERLLSSRSDRLYDSPSPIMTTTQERPSFGAYHWRDRNVPNRIVNPSPAVFPLSSQASSSSSYLSTPSTSFLY